MMIEEIRKLVAKQNKLRGKNTGLLRDFDDELASVAIGTFMLSEKWTFDEIERTILEFLHSTTEADVYIGLLIIQEANYLSPSVVNGLVSRFKSEPPTTRLFSEFLHIIDEFHIPVAKNVVFSKYTELKRNFISGDIELLNELGRLARIYYQRNERDGANLLIYFFEKDFNLDDPGFCTRSACVIASLLRDDSYRPLIPLLIQIRNFSKDEKFINFMINQVGAAVERNSYLYKDTALLERQKNYFTEKAKDILFLQ